MPLAYCLLCHANDAYVADLFRYLYRPDDTFIIHADRKAPAALHGLINDLAAQFPNVQVMSPSLCSWGGYSLVDVTLRGIAFAAFGVRDFSHFVLLTEHHLPLIPPEEIARRLAPGTSYIEASPVSGYRPFGLADVRHRFAMRYRELAGVGSFGTAARDLPDEWHGNLYHGSQCIVLSRQACERLASEPNQRLLKLRFGDSLLPDEIALQTAFYATPIGEGLTLDRANQTFVASPDRGGGPGAEFTSENLHAAKQQYYSFIRKRPGTLPTDLMADLEAMANLPRFRIPARAPVAQSLDIAPVAHIAAELRDRLRALHPTGSLEIIQPQAHGTSPRCFLRVRIPSMPADLSVVVVSEDLATFKVAAVWEAPFEGSHAPSRLGGYRAAVIKVRVAGLFLTREVHALEDADYGFVELRPNDSARLLAAPIDTALQRIGAITSTGP